MKPVDKKSLLFVCLGNICRSPAAEAILKYKLEDNKRLAGRIEVDSAGIGSWHEGQLPDRRMRSHGASRGYDLSSRARQIKPADFSRFDYVFAMDHQNVADLNRVARNDDDRKKIMCTADFMTHHRNTTPCPTHITEAMPTSSWLSTLSKMPATASLHGSKNSCNALTSNA